MLVKCLRHLAANWRLIRAGVSECFSLTPMCGVPDVSRTFRCRFPTRKKQHHIPSACPWVLGRYFFYALNARK